MAARIDSRPVTARDVHLLNVELDDVRARRREVTRQLLQVLRSYVLPRLELTDDTPALVANLLGTNAVEAAYVLQGMQEALGVPGDVCEFGVAQGRTSALIAHQLLGTDRHLWLYDSFEGLPAPTAKDELVDDIFGLGSMDAYTGTMKNPEALVREQLAKVQFPEARTHVVRGWVEETIGQGVGPERVAFAYLDCDLYSPTICILRSIHDRLSVGSVLVLDDYGYFSSGVATAVAEFMADYPHGYDLRAPFDVDVAGAFRVLRRIG